MGRVALREDLGGTRERGQEIEREREREDRKRQSDFLFVDEKRSSDFSLKASSFFQSEGFF